MKFSLKLLPFCCIAAFVCLPAVSAETVKTDGDRYDSDLSVPDAAAGSTATTKVSQKASITKKVAAVLPKVKKKFYLNPLKSFAQDSKLMFSPLLEDVSLPLKGTESNLKALQEPLRNLEKPLQEVSGSVHTLKAPLEDLKAPMNDLKAPIGELKEPIAELKHPINNLNKPITQLARPIQDLSAPINKLQHTMTAIPQPLERLVQPLDSLRKPLDGIASPLNNLQPSIKNLAPPVAELSNSVSSLNREVRSLSGEMKQLREAVFDICIYVSLAIVLGCSLIAGTLMWFIRHFARSYGLSPAKALRFVANLDDVKNDHRR